MTTYFFFSYIIFLTKKFDILVWYKYTIFSREFGHGPCTCYRKDFADVVKNCKRMCLFLPEGLIFANDIERKCNKTALVILKKVCDGSRSMNRAFPRSISKINFKWHYFCKVCIFFVKVFQKKNSWEFSPKLKNV